MDDCKVRDASESALTAQHDQVLACYQDQFRLQFLPGRRRLYRRKTGMSFVSERERRRDEARKREEFAAQTQVILGLPDVVEWETKRIVSADELWRKGVC